MPTKRARGDTFAIGGLAREFFLRNARFKPEAESPIMPRYGVARVTGVTAGASASGEGGIFTGGEVRASSHGHAGDERKSRGTNQDRWVFHAR